MSEARIIKFSDLKNRVKVTRLRVNNFLKFYEKTLEDLRLRLITVGKSEIEHTEFLNRQSLNKDLTDLLNEVHIIEIDLDIVENKLIECRPLWSARKVNYDSHHLLIQAKWHSLSYKELDDHRFGFYNSTWNPLEENVTIIRDSNWC
jgi:hypothetical protein